MKSLHNNNNSLQNQQSLRQNHQEEGNDGLVFIVLITFFLSFSYEAIPSGGREVLWFPLSEQLLTFKTYLYFLLQDIYKSVLLFCIWRATQYRIMKIFFLCQCVLILDYLLSYNSYGIPMDFIYVGFSLSIVRVLLILQTVFFIKFLWTRYQ